MPEMPRGSVLVRTTPEFDETSVPAGLLRAHRVADGVFGRLVVRAGALGFAFDDESTAVERVLEAGDEQIIPPVRRHHVSVVGPVRFVVEFYEPPIR